MIYLLVVTDDSTMRRDSTEVGLKEQEVAVSLENKGFSCDRSEQSESHKPRVVVFVFQGRWIMICIFLTHFVLFETLLFSGKKLGFAENWTTID